MVAHTFNVQLLCSLLLVVSLSWNVIAHGHSHNGHGHSHGHHGHNHGHHDDDHHHDEHDHHGHAHEDHGHAHEDHGHAHEDHGDGHADHRHFYHASSYQEEEGKPEAHNDPPTNQHNDEQESHSHSSETGTPSKADESWRMWGEAIGATVLISAAPFLILFLIPLDKDQAGKEGLLKVLLSFASGGLLGDAFLHLIPHAVNPHTHGAGEEGHSHSHDHGHSHGTEAHDHSHDMIVGLWVLTGIVLFLIIEKSVRHITGEDAHGHSHGHSDSHSAAEQKEEDKDGDDKNVRRRKKTDENKENTDENKEKTDEIEETDDSKQTNETKEDEQEIEPEKIKVSAYLNLAADCTHNFTDGLAIGASFLVSRQLGIITTITILLHEVPHEIGDFAILVQSGCSKQKAMYLQLLTAVGAITGCICALLAEGAGESATLWILPITAGGFIYIATVSVIPTLLEKSSIAQSIAEIFGLLAGVGLMVLIAYAE